LQIYFGNSRCHIARAIEEEMEYSRCKQVSHPVYSSDLAITDLYLFGKIKEELRTMKVSSREEVLNVMTGVFRKYPKHNVKGVIDHSMHRCDWVISHKDEYY
jgi:hypothetical protein